MSNLDSFLQKLIVFLFLALFFLVPLFFTPFNSELFEFNKIILVYAFSSLIAGAWLGRMILQRRIFFTRTPLDIPLALFLVSQVASTLFSIDRHTSIFGYYSRFNGGLLSTASYLLLYWALVSNCNEKNVIKFLKISLISGLLVSIYGILEHFGHSFSCLMFEGKFGVSCWVQKVQERVFATLGQPNWLAAYLAVLIPISLGLALNLNYESRIKNKGKYFSKFIIHCSVFSILYLCLLFTGSRSGFLGLAVGLVIFWLVIFYLNFHQIKTIIKPFLLFTVSCLLFTVIFGSPLPYVNKFLFYRSFLPSTTHNSQPTTPVVSQLPPDILISESGDIRRIVWKGALEIFKHYPVFGSGVETFAYSYYNFRPMEHNLVSEWDFLYNKAHNEYLNFLATTGLVGLGSYLLLIIWFSLWSLKQIWNMGDEPRTMGKNNNNQFPLFIVHCSLFSAWLSILVSNFFGFSVVVVSLYFYLLPAFVFVLSEISAPPIPPKPSNPPSLVQKLLLLVVFVLTFCVLRFAFNLWQADKFYSFAQKYSNLNQPVLAYENLQKSISLFPSEPVFLNELSYQTAMLALLASEKKDSSTSAQFTNLAIELSDSSLKISPRNLNFYKTRVRMFYILSTIDSSYLNKAIETLSLSAKLAPTDPKLIYNLGLLYNQKGDPQKSLEYFQKALEMKPNYEEARNALTILYEGLGEKQKAIEQLKYILQTKPNDQSILDRIEKLK